MSEMHESNEIDEANKQVINKGMDGMSQVNLAND